MLIATYITAIVRATVSGSGAALWLIAPTEGIPALIRVNDRGLIVVSLLRRHTCAITLTLFSALIYSTMQFIALMLIPC